MHTCAKFWTRNAAVQSVRTPRQVLNPDFEKNMAKNWAEFRQPSRADGLAAGQNRVQFCSNSVRLRADRPSETALTDL